MTWGVQVQRSTQEGCRGWRGSREGSDTKAKEDATNGDKSEYHGQEQFLLFLFFQEELTQQQASIIRRLALVFIKIDAVPFFDFNGNLLEYLQCQRTSLKIILLRSTG